MTETATAPAFTLVVGVMMIFGVPYTTMDYFNAAGFQDCSEDEIEVKKLLLNSYCINYQQNIQKMLESMQKVEQPVSEDIIAQLTPGLNEQEVQLVLERHRAETGEVVERGVNEWVVVQK